MSLLHYLEHYPCPNCNWVGNLTLCNAHPVHRRAPAEAHNSPRWLPSTEWRGLFVCPNCHSGLLASFRSQLDWPALNSIQPIEDDGHRRRPGIVMPQKFGQPLNAHVSDVSWHPIEPIRKPEAMPEAIAEAFEDMCDAHHNARLAVGAARRLLETVCEHLLDGKPKRLIDGIRQLREAGHLTQALVDLADHLREKGNAALHDHDRRPTVEEAHEAMELARFIVEQTIELPERLSRVRRDHTHFPRARI